jgi:hypothetical protein
MNAPESEFSLIADLEARQDELLLQLDELDKRVERTLAECQVKRILQPDHAGAITAAADRPFQQC